MLNQIRMKFDLHTDALKIMKTLRNHASIIKSLLTKRQRILSKFNSNRVLEALTQSDDFVDSASDAVDYMWHKKKVVGLFSMGKVQRVLEQYALKGSKVSPLDASLFANTFLHLKFSLLSKTANAEFKADAIIFARLTRSEKTEFKVGLQTYLDAVPYALAADATR
jgi:hypothetical protein